MVLDESPFAGYNKITDENYRGAAASPANNYATRLLRVAGLLRLVYQRNI